MNIWSTWWIYLLIKNEYLVILHAWNTVKTPQSMRSLCMMMSSNGNIFRVTGHLCGEITGPRRLPRTKACDAELWCFFFFFFFFYQRLNKRWSKQSWGLWFETLLHPLWRHCNGMPPLNVNQLHWSTINTFWPIVQNLAVRQQIRFG